MSWFEMLFGGNGGGAAANPVDGPKARELVKQGAQLVDVRSPGEFAGGHVKGAKNIPVDQLAARLGELDKSKPVVVYCLSGGREPAGEQRLRGGVRSRPDEGVVNDTTARLSLPVLASLTLGLAPFVPEPHLVGKLRWVAGGAVGMGPMDWFDLGMHGAPWLWLVAALFNELRLALARARPRSA